MSHESLALLKLIYIHHLSTEGHIFHMSHVSENAHGDTADRMHDYYLLQDLVSRQLIETADQQVTLESYCDEGSIDIKLTPKGFTLAQHL